MSCESRQICDCDRNWVLAVRIYLFPRVGCRSDSCGVSDEVGHVRGWHQNLQWSHLTWIYKHSKRVRLCECSKGKLFGCVWNLYLTCDSDWVLAYERSICGCVYGEKFVICVMDYKRGQPIDGNSFFISTGGCLHVTVTKWINWEVSKLDRNVCNLPRIVKGGYYAGVDCDSERVWESSDSASVWLRESVRWFIHILPDLHVQSVHANVVDCGRSQSKRIHKGQTLGRQTCPTGGQSEEGKRGDHFDEVVATVLFVNCLHVVLLIGQILHLIRPSHRISDHVSWLGWPNEATRGTVTRVVHNCN